MEGGLISVFGVWVMSPMFAWAFRPFNMFNPWQLDIQCTVISAVFTINVDRALNITSSHINWLSGLKENIYKPIFCVSWTHFLNSSLKKLMIIKYINFIIIFMYFISRFKWYLIIFMRIGKIEIKCRIFVFYFKK